MPGSLSQHQSFAEQHDLLTRSVDISLDKDIDTTDTIKLNLNVLVFPPVAHLSHVLTACIVLLISCKGQKLVKLANQESNTNPRRAQHPYPGC